MNVWQPWVRQLSLMMDISFKTDCNLAKLIKRVQNMHTQIHYTEKLYIDGQLGTPKTKDGNPTESYKNLSFIWPLPLNPRKIIHL